MSLPSDQGCLVLLEVTRVCAGAGQRGVPDPGLRGLTGARVIDKPRGLSVEELKKVRAYEMEHEGRNALLTSIEHRIRTAR